MKNFSSLLGIFQFSRDITGHLSRNIHRLFVPKVFINWSFYYHGTVLWNNLKSTVTEATTLLSFRNYYLILNCNFVFVSSIVCVCVCMHVCFCVSVCCICMAILYVCLSRAPLKISYTEWTP